MTNPIGKFQNFKFQILAGISSRTFTTEYSKSMFQRRWPGQLPWEGTGLAQPAQRRTSPSLSAPLALSGPD
jgi:hypothetical protein